MKKALKNLLHSLGYEILPYPAYVMNSWQIATVRYLSEMFNGLPEGDVVECGVGFGRSLIYLSYLAGKEGDRKVYGFDSFEGFPSPDPNDKSPRNPQEGDVWVQATKEKVRQAIRNANLEVANVSLVEGFFEETVSSWKGPIALLHIDVDLYQSYKTVLETLYPFVVKGGVILFDEYGLEAWPGATKAIDEFFAKKGGAIQRHPESGKYFFRK